MTLLRVSQAATALGISAQTLVRWADAGKIAVLRMPGTGERRVELDEVERVRAPMRGRQPQGQEQSHTKGGKTER